MDLRPGGRWAEAVGAASVLKQPVNPKHGRPKGHNCIWYICETLVGCQAAFAGKSGRRIACSYKIKSRAVYTAPPLTTQQAER